MIVLNFIKYAMLKVSFKQFSLLFLGVMLLFFSNNAFADFNPGIITGKVLDSETGEVLRSATVFVVGTKIGGRTDVTGEFKIKNIPPGTYNVRVSYVGYTAKEITGVEIKPGQTTNLTEILLTPQISQTKEVVVQADRIMDSQASILAVRKNAEQVSDGISAEEIKKTTDSDAGQSLRRVSGITLVNDKFIYVRGVSERYSSTMLNGASLATTEPDKKAFAFDMFPAEFLEFANIAKSFTPDLPGNFAGGLVQLNTIDFPQGYSLKLSISQSFNDNVTLKDRGFISYSGASSDWLGYDNGFRSMPGDIPASKSVMDKLLYYDIKSASVSDDERYAAQQKWINLGKEFNDNSWKRDTLAAPLSGTYKLSYTDIYQIAGNDFGLIASGMYSGGYSSNSLSRAVLYYSNGDMKFHGDGIQSTYSTGIGGILNFAYKIGEANAISFKNTYNNTSDNEIISITGKKEETFLKQMSFDFVQKTLLASQLHGEHLLPFLQNSTLNWNLGYSLSKRYQPDFRRLRYSRNDTTQPYRIDIGDNPQGNGTMAGRFYSDLNENAYSGGLNIILPLSDAKIKFGGLYEAKTRDFVVRSFTIIKSYAVA
ncbi:MAG: hypothetical protein QG635_1316 [Bacteroidota bacterium]|nr:hypothetical protein [Bacteroidota bacterium]